jgi:type II secretory ATPase GspE/PulE/Tfp pilus assembly ATPase PilB-like protein
VFNLGALPYMVAGTFNVVMAQRLIRRICSECKTTTSIKDTPQRKDAVDAFRGLDPTVLKNEIVSRDITPDQWKSFITDGVMTS